MKGINSFICLDYVAVRRKIPSFIYSFIYLFIYCLGDVGLAKVGSEREGGKKKIKRNMKYYLLLGISLLTPWVSKKERKKERKNI